MVAEVKPMPDRYLSRQKRRTAEEKQRILDEIHRRSLEEFRSVKSLVEEKGICMATYYAWNRANTRMAAFRQVEVAPVTTAPPMASLSIITPGGYRVEGLSLSDMAQLLRILG